MTLRNAFADLATEDTLASVDAKTPALVSGRTPVDGSGVTQPVSAASLPLPAGAATAANQSTLIGHVDGIEGALSTIDADTGSIDAKLPALSNGKVPVVGPLTDTELRATAVPVSVAALPLPAGGATAANQATVIASLANLDTDLGAPADSAASTDTGTFSLIALVKRQLQNWTTLLSRVPSNLTVTSTRLLVDGSGVTQPVSGPLTDTQLRASVVPTAPNITRGSGVMDANTQRVTLATDGPGVGALTSIDGKTAALINGRGGVEPLGQPGVARQLAAGATSVNTALTTTCRRISILARSADIRYAIGSTSQTASATSHFIGIGERLDLVVPATPNIAVIRDASTSGTLEVTELV